MSLVVWRFKDGKAGHESQSAGLIEALSAQVPIERHELAPGDLRFALVDFLRGRYRPGSNMADPDILVGAGHATHLPMLAARRARGGRSVVLMKPSLPLRCFDLCIVPEHDRVSATDKVLVTRGVLTRMRPSAAHRPGTGLILVGGPSVHHAWSDTSLAAQLEQLFAREPATQWTVTTSRRTPAGTCAAIDALLPSAVDLVAFDSVDSAWLPARLARAEKAWVTEDSVSMVYEALTAGAATGLLPVPRKKQGRVAHGLDSLVAEHLVTAFDDWLDGTPLVKRAEPFD